jgi:hypothetical protein
MREQLVSITIDYETWQPDSEKYRIDWQKDIIDNTYSLMESIESTGARITIMAEMGEYLWLEENMPNMAEKIVRQLQDAIIRGHDVQLHLHPNWLPETGAVNVNGEYFWNWRYANANDYPFDLSELIGRCQRKLEEIIKPYNQDYRVTCFRAGGYRVQPFGRLSNALMKNGIYCDSSVYCGGVSEKRGYDFSNSLSRHQPYFCNLNDPQYKDQNSLMIEMPICTFPQKGRWFLDNNTAHTFGRQFLYANAKMFSFDKNIYVLIGHSKGEHDYNAITRQLKLITRIPNTKFVTLSELEKTTRKINCQFTKAQSSPEEVFNISEQLYKTLSPERSQTSIDIADILEGGYAFCMGYTAVLVVLARRFGYQIKPLSLYAVDMPNGRGNSRWDTHEVAYLYFNSKRYIIDTMACTFIPYSIYHVLADPSLIKNKINPDERYELRNYHHYDTCFFYKRVKYFKIGDYRISKPRDIFEGRRNFFLRQWHNIFHSILPRLISYQNIWKRT